MLRFITQRGAGGVLLSDNTNLKLGQPVIDILRQNHSALIVTSVELLVQYNAVPEFVPVNVTKDTAEAISRRLTGTVGPGRISTVGLQ